MPGNRRSSRAVSAAKPKIADYPFTTLQPQLGVVEIDGREFVLADIPGLIEGAHEGVGLGDRFLGHVERCRVLLHLVDGTGGDAGAAYKTVRAELAAYGNGLADKPEIVALNKADALSADEIKQQTGAAQTRGEEAAARRLGGERRRRRRSAACALSGDRNSAPHRGRGKHRDLRLAAVMGARRPGGVRPLEAAGVVCLD